MQTENTQSLLRQGIADGSARNSGAIILISKPSGKIWSGLAAIILAALLGAMYFLNIPEIERVGGRVAFVKEPAAIRLPKDGTLTRILVNEGQRVHPGQALFEWCEVSSFNFMAPSQQCTGPLVQEKALLGGTVSKIAGVIAQPTATHMDVLRIAANGQALQVEFRAPEAVVGALKPGQRVWFEFERLAHDNAPELVGRIESVQDTPMKEPDTGMMAMAAGPDQYRVLASLPTQAIQSKSRQYPLVPDMVVKGKVYVGTKPLYKWLWMRLD